MWRARRRSFLDCAHCAVIAPAVNRGQAPAGGGNPCEAGLDANSVPPYLRLGSVCIMPIGFMDATYFWRDKSR